MVIHRYLIKLSTTDKTYGHFI